MQCAFQSISYVDFDKDELTSLFSITVLELTSRI